MIATAGFRDEGRLLLAFAISRAATATKAANRTFARMPSAIPRGLGTKVSSCGPHLFVEDSRPVFEGAQSVPDLL